MGNCVRVPFHPPQEKIKVVVFNGGVEEFSAPTTAEEITSGPYTGYKLVHKANPYTPLRPGTKLEPGEVYHLVPNLVWLNKASVPSKMAHQEQQSGKRQKVRIVVTREQLGLLLNGAKKIRSLNIGSRGSQEPRKWRPSLAMIPEVRKF
ncbi:hypothetical protein RchiOBHm_Chr5g0000641 [Rosa chinensis]|uniref:Uncharacterized protein n=1 Tax=Rosa chinensis TaxID=74649 RepID=A0A2P6Q220_ROSCH|nr:hypothetical protein RchiOBHm_Chr5g0000641 [Rosa chinensis]